MPNLKDTLTNAKIIQLTKLGLQPSVILLKMHSSVTHFDVSTDALVNLSTNSVSTDVINEMMNMSVGHDTELENQVNLKIRIRFMHLEFIITILMIRIDR